MNPTTNSGQAISNEDYLKRKAILEKSWAEATVEEKLEKVREELIQLGHMSYLINNLQQEATKFKEHMHVDGKVVIPVNGPALNGLGGLGAVRRNNLN